MIQFITRNNERDHDSTPSMSLAIDSSEVQEIVLSPTITDLTRGSIIACASGVGAGLKLVQRKLDNLDHTKSY